MPLPILQKEPDALCFRYVRPPVRAYVLALGGGIVRPACRRFLVSFFVWTNDKNRNVKLHFWSSRTNEKLKIINRFHFPVLLFTINSFTSNNSVVGLLVNCSIDSLCDSQRQRARASQARRQIRYPRPVECRYDCEDEPKIQHSSPNTRSVDSNCSDVIAPTKRVVYPKWSSVH